MKRGRSSVWEPLTTKSNRLKTDSDQKSAGSVMGSNPIVPIYLDIKNVIFSNPDISRNIVIPNILTSFLAEDIGIQIGDGGIFVYKNSNGGSHYRVECYGHITEDETYLNNFVRPLKENLFNLNLKLKYHNSAGTCYLKIGSKALVTFYHNVIGLPVGKKLEVPIPEIILNSSNEIITAFLRGLGDTDFSLTFQKKGKDVHYYPVIHLSNRSKILVRQTSQVLNRLGIPNSTTFDYNENNKKTGKTYIKHDLFINGKRNLELWMKLIGFHNPKHLTRYLVWKKLGFCPPRTTLEQRIGVLNGNTNIEFLEK